MTRTHAVPSPTRLLLPFGLAMVIANVALQVVIIATDHEIGVLAALLTAVIAVGYAVYLIVCRTSLGRTRFGDLTAHVLTYASVNTGFGLHLVMLAALGHGAVAADGPGLMMDPGWFGAAVAMPALWGLGLLMHALGAVLGRGFEASR